MATLIRATDEIDFTMKIYLSIIFCSSVLFLFSCSNPENDSDENKEISRKNILLNDSLNAVNRAIDTFNLSVLSCKDSIRKYKMASINDTCLKYMYVIYGAENLKNYDSLIVSECGIKITGFKKLADSVYSLRYTLFIKDSIPIVPELFANDIIHTFEYNSMQQKFIKAYLGQHSTYIDGNGLRKLYSISLNNEKNKKYLTVNFAKLNPDFIRLVLSNQNNGK